MIYDLQKASLWKRISAGLFDLIIFAVVAIGIASFMSFLLKYDEKMDFIEERKAVIVEKCEKDYELEHGKRVELDLSRGYEEMTDEQKEIYNMVDEALGKDKNLSIAYTLLLNYTLLMMVVSTFISYLIFEFAVPLLLKNGQTIGKKIFGLGVMRTNSVRVSPMVLCVRMLLGKCTIETVVPMFIILMMFFGIIGIMGPIVLLAILILQIVMMCVTRTNSTIHDLISDTVVVDLTSQMIFESEQAMIDYKKKLHEEEVSRSPY